MTRPIRCPDCGEELMSESYQEEVFTLRDENARLEAANERMAAALRAQGCHAPEDCPGQPRHPNFPKCVKCVAALSDDGEGRLPLLTLRQLQAELRPWQEHNFPGRESWQPLLGIQEEVGELSHAHLKEHQRIRGTPEEHQAEAKDAVADVVVFLADYCNARGWDFQQLLEETWAEVRKRDWQADRAALDALKGE
jgi:NTP pyrophosphatase (non-canonical NTP hydrolase)